MKNLFLLLILFPVLCFGQEEGKIDSIEISAPITTLDHAKGHIYDASSGYTFGSDQSIIIYNGFTYDSFTNFEFREVSYKGEEYLLLIKHYDYLYPDPFSKPIYSRIKKEYMFCFLFDKQEYLSQLTSNDSIFHIKCHMLLDDTWSDIQIDRDNEKNVSFLKKAIERNVDNIKKNKFYNVIIQFRNYKDQGISRFLIFYEKCRKYETELDCDYIGFGGSDNEISADHDYYNKLGTDEIYNWIYYECNYESFNNFITLRKQK